MEDIHIINLFLERSEDAIRQVEVKYEKFCFKIAWNILYNTEDSEECVNDTWLITWNKIPPKTPTKLSAFLGKITRNLALDNFRKKNASKRADTHMMDICGEVEKLENTIKDYVEEDIKKKEILNILEKFLGDLKAGDRDIFVRRYWYMDNIKDIAKRHGCSETKIKSSLFRSRNRLWEEVKDRLHTPAGRMSIGQQQRLCLARGLAVEPQFILADEATSALDPISSKTIEDLFLKLKEEYAIVLVTHTLRQALRIADYVIFMYMGEIIEAGPAEQIFKNPQKELTQKYLAGVFS